MHYNNIIPTSRSVRPAQVWYKFDKILAIKLWIQQTTRYSILLVKANTNSDKQLETAATFFLSNLYLKQRIG